MRQAGERAGVWLLIERSGRRAGRAHYWRVSCTVCGAEHEGIPAELSKRRCGACHEAAKGETRPEPGTMVGVWTLVRFEGMAPGGQRWLVRCACGTERVANLAALRYGVKIKRGRMCRVCSTQTTERRAAYRRRGLQMSAQRFGERDARMMIGQKYGDDEAELLLDAQPRESYEPTCELWDASSVPDED